MPGAFRLMLLYILRADVSRVSSASRGRVLCPLTLQLFDNLSIFLELTLPPFFHRIVNLYKSTLADAALSWGEKELVLFSFCGIPVRQFCPFGSQFIDLFVFELQREIQFCGWGHSHGGYPVR